MVHQSRDLFVLTNLICNLYPDLDTWTVFPWGDENGAVAGLICDIYTSAGEPFAGDPHGNLKRLCVIWKKLVINHLTRTRTRILPFQIR